MKSLRSTGSAQAARAANDALPFLRAAEVVAGTSRPEVWWLAVYVFGIVDTLAALPMNLPASLAPAAADFMADHVFSRIDIPGWLARTGFQMLDPIKTAQSRVDFLRQLHDREALLPREQQRRFLASEGWIAWSGPAISEQLKQFIAHNRMMTGGFSIHGDLVTLSDIDCPVLADFEDQPDRWVDLRWREGRHPPVYSSRLGLTIRHDAGVLGRICTLIGQQGANISDLEFLDRKPDFYRLRVDVDLRDREHLHTLLTALEAESDVAQVARIRDPSAVV